MRLACQGSLWLLSLTKYVFEIFKTEQSLQ